jgi:2-dehydro-3-deoxyphosphogluconate aldolase / (4S)-4-hydroxy-2-oxoglutarate aldolase
MTPTAARPDALARLVHTGLLAVLRGEDADEVGRAAETLADAGVEVLEVTFTVPGCADLISRLKVKLPEVLVGAGTVTTPAQIAAALDAGADFLVTPGATAHLLDALASSGAAYLPGVLTPSEVVAAVESGAPGVKLFPGSVVGPSGLAALRGPFPDLPVVPTGGVRPDNVAQWFAAGAVAVGAGSDLASRRAVTDHDLLRTNARRWISAVRSARSGDSPTATRT